MSEEELNEFIDDYGVDYTSTPNEYRIANDAIRYFYNYLKNQNK